jgi:peptidyl-prolyl cis-trans isomerase B (cyclophilin B)
MRSHLLIAGAAAGALVLAGCGSSGTTTTNQNGCVPVTAPATSSRNAPRPTTSLDVTLKYDVTITTNCGSFTIRLDPSQSPNATASFASLVKRGFYDGTLFHRIMPGFVIQGGDPTGTGTGGPGYTTLDPPPADVKYTHGVVAMAKTGTQPPGTGGSQFFVATSSDTGLTPDYAVIGTVLQGLDVIDRIGKLGDSNGHPTQPVELEHATLRSFR